jgi:hypothetical protein
MIEKQASFGSIAGIFAGLQVATFYPIKKTPAVFAGVF